MRCDKRSVLGSRLAVPSARQLRGLGYKRPQCDRRVLCITVLMVFSVAGSLGLSAETVDSHGLLSNAIEGWKRIESSMLPLTATARTDSEGESIDPKDPNFGKRQSIKYGWEFAVTETSKKVSLDIFDEAGTWKRRRVTGSNPDYGFTANQLTESGAYFLSECGRGPRQLEHVNGSLSAFSIGLFAPIGVGGEVEPLTELVKRDTFKLLGAREVEDDGRTFVEFQVTFAADDGKGIAIPVTSVITVDPAAGWRVIRSTSEKTGQTTVMEVEYGGRGAFDDLRKVTWNYAFPAAKSVQTFYVISLSHETTAEREFYLSSLGLPDCAPLSPNDSRGLVYLALNLMLIGTILAVIARRRRASLQ